jgi:hypothetical protein
LLVFVDRRFPFIPVVQRREPVSKGDAAVQWAQTYQIQPLFILLMSYLHYAL